VVERGMVGHGPGFLMVGVCGLRGFFSTGDDNHECWW